MAAFMTVSSNKLSSASVAVNRPPAGGFYFNQTVNGGATSQCLTNHRRVISWLVHWHDSDTTKHQQTQCCGKSSEFAQFFAYLLTVWVSYLMSCFHRLGVTACAACCRNVALITPDQLHKIVFLTVTLTVVTVCCWHCMSFRKALVSSVENNRTLDKVGKR